MDAPYIINRDRSFINRYKLNRRALEIGEAIASFSPNRRLSILDIGSSDGALLSFLNKKLAPKRSVGIEPSLDCIKFKKSEKLLLIPAVGEEIPFCDSTFDAIVGASVIDHLSDVGKFLNESRRVLRKDGLLAVTAIVPFYDRLANMLKVDNGLHPHARTFSLDEMQGILKEYGFRILLAKRFALPSFGLLPFERYIEGILNRLHLNKLLFYSLAVGQRSD